MHLVAEATREARFLKLIEPYREVRRLLHASIAVSVTPDTLRTKRRERVEDVEIDKNTRYTGDD
jgi:hypothetical protein